MRRVNSRLQVDWIGRDRVVEVVFRKSSEAMDDALATRGLRLWNAAAKAETFGLIYLPNAV